jgi:hypothetical protein
MLMPFSTQENGANSEGMGINCALSIVIILNIRYNIKVLELKIEGAVYTSPAKKSLNL